MGSRRRTSATTLIELMTVMAILAVLTIVGAGAIAGMKQRGHAARARAELAVLAAALERYRNHFGDYPQLGEFAHADAPGGSARTATAETKLFNCLTGVFGPRAFAAGDRLSGPNFLEGTRFLDSATGALDGQLARTFLIPSSAGALARPEQDVRLLDPWGRPYLYYYKDRRSAAAWPFPGYILYSVGPDGAHIAPAWDEMMTGNRLAETNADNIYANR